MNSLIILKGKQLKSLLCSESNLIKNKKTTLMFMDDTQMLVTVKQIPQSNEDIFKLIDTGSLYQQLI